MQREQARYSPSELLRSPLGPLSAPDMRTIRDALDAPDANEWRAAMDIEIENIRRLNVFKTVQRPPDTNMPQSCVSNPSASFSRSPPGTTSVFVNSTCQWRICMERSMVMFIWSHPQATEMETPSGI